MARSKGSKDARSGATPKSSRAVSRPGLPAPDEVVATATLRSPKGGLYRVLRTSERDAYEPSDDREGNPTRRKRPPETP